MNFLKKYISIFFGDNFLNKLKIFYTKFFPYAYRQYYYSQFGEDVPLRVFIGDKIKKKGFYVDVGAYHPIHLSNTYYFYKNGWQGINIDVNPKSIEMFDVVRKRDININAAVSNCSGTATFYSWDSVYDTISDEEAKKIRKKVGPEKFSKEVSVKSLKEILDNNLGNNQKIDFLSIDVEGVDLQVLKSNDWNKYKPEFLIVEEHETDINKLLNSEKFKYLDSFGYKLVSWTCLSYIFKFSN